MFSEDMLFGATPEEVIGIINYVSGHEDTSWTAHGDQRTGEALIAGITLRVRQVFHDKGLTRLSITGNGWMIGFTVTHRRPRNLPESQPSMVTKIELANHPSVAKHGRAAMLCLHGLTVVSPENFRKEMALLRMFNSEWA